MGSSPLAKNSRNSLEKGFTLIELLVVIIVLGILIVAVMGLLNPFEQFTKAKDSQRQQDLNQIRAAIDTYYNDTGCYPQSVPFGGSFANPKKSSVIYMKKVPQDPTCSSDNTKCYKYITDTNVVCPQWNVLLGALQAKYVNNQDKTLCALETLDANTQGGCLPSYYHTNGYNFCLTSGQVDCSAINSIPVSIAPTPTPTPSCPKIYACTSRTNQLPNGTCNIVGTDNQGNGYGDYCGFPGCIGNACCSNACSN